MPDQDNISQNKEIPNYLFFSLKHRLILINYNLLLIIIGTKVIDYINEWNLLKNNKVSNNKKYYINYLNSLIKEELKKIEEIKKEVSSNYIIIINNINNNEIWTSFYENFLILEKTFKKILKQNTKYCVKTNNINFNNFYYYKNLKTLEINGEEEEFLKKTLAKFKF